MKHNRTPTSAQFAEALRSVRMIPVQRQMLVEHYKAGSHTLTTGQLAEKIGYDSYSAVNAVYGTLARRVAKVLRWRPHRYAIAVFVTFKQDAQSHWLWQMRPEVAEALERLGWCKDRVQDEQVFLRNYEREVTASRRDTTKARRKRLASAAKRPEMVRVLRDEYSRNPDVAAEVLERAKGICESCHSSAPFCRASDGTPYLEIHHMKQLSDGGEDTVENAEALCPNCHRKKHFGR
ncbi:MAG: HNH endonuclease, partial [Bacteroidota bacterium]